MEDKNKFGIILGGIAGLIAGYSLGSCDPCPLVTEVTQIKSYQISDKKEVLKIRRPGRDYIFIDADSKAASWNLYVPLNHHLKKIPTKVDRDIEELKIKKAIGWYDE